MKSETAKSNVLNQADGFTDSNSKIRFHYDEMKIDFWENIWPMNVNVTYVLW